MIRLYKAALVVTGVSIIFTAMFFLAVAIFAIVSEPRGRITVTPTQEEHVR